MTPYSRLNTASSAACKELANETAAKLGFSDFRLTLTLSVPKTSARTVAGAPLKVLWPEVKVGKFGVTINGVQVGSAVVSGLPSVPAARIAVIGRQKL